uniref:Protein kinase domain-containing protein n=2 Tax=Caenorhabditis japonica TaxID=281687 RepID=A0A8R1DIM5_CAEJA
MVKITVKEFFDFGTLRNTDPCSELDVIVTAYSENAISIDSKEIKIDQPQPTANPKLDLLEMLYYNTSFDSEFYHANATVYVKFRYESNSWFLGDEDLNVQPLFHLISCVDPDLSQGVPVPEFTVHSINKTISTTIGSDMMDRKCRYGVSSKRCGTNTEISSPPSSALQTVQIKCDTVKNAPCSILPSIPHPQCGKIDRVEWEILARTRADINDPAGSVTVNVTFSPVSRSNDIPTLYYIGIYGEAEEYKTKEEETFLGVNLTKVLGKTSSCQKFDSSEMCLMENNNRSFIIQGLHPGQLYGLTICAIKDKRNITLPDFSQAEKSVKPKSVKLMIPDNQDSMSTGWIVGLSIGMAIVFMTVIVICIIHQKRKIRDKKFLKFEISQREKESRYTDFPTGTIKNDVWEIERRNLIIYDDKKLGSGAFGAVFLGKLLGKSLAHKDANSPLGINMMRTENCQVAVKMLPEYADNVSKHEFLREILLMKTLGYHERLVNMLACITESEPLCLVVEYCDNGDLQQFLRERCRYMMKLDELLINYNDPPKNENYDATLIISLKLLLQFAVQISYGLEYLSHTGFVHRDVAARNVLVHKGKFCKIGDFGLCRYIYADQSQYRSKGGKLPLKWMSPEAIRHYQFSIKSDVWSFGILLFEVITLGGSPYPGMAPEDVLPFLENNGRISKPDNCPEKLYEVMKQCWFNDPDDRMEFSAIRMELATQLEEIADDYNYLKLDAEKDYYNVSYEDQK